MHCTSMCVKLQCCYGERTNGMLLILSEYFREESFVPPHRQKPKLKILLKFQTEIGPHNHTRLIIDRSNI